MRNLSSWNRAAIIMSPLKYAFFLTSSPHLLQVQLHNSGRGARTYALNRRSYGSPKRGEAVGVRFYYHLFAFIKFYSFFYIILNSHFLWHIRINSKLHTYGKNVISSILPISVVIMYFPPHNSCTLGDVEASWSKDSSDVSHTRCSQVPAIFW